MPVGAALGDTADGHGTGDVRWQVQGELLNVVQRAPLRTRIFSWMLTLTFLPITVLLALHAAGWKGMAQPGEPGHDPSGAQIGLGLVLPLLALGVLVLVGRSVATVDRSAMRLRRWYRLCGLRLALRDQPCAGQVVRIEQDGDASLPSDERPARWMVSLATPGQPPGTTNDSDGYGNARGLLVAWLAQPAAAADLAAALAQHLAVTVETIAAPAAEFAEKAAPHGDDQPSAD